LSEQQHLSGRLPPSWSHVADLNSYCCGNVVGTQIFLPKDAPKYIHGLIACAIVLGVNMLNLAGWWHYYVRTNRRRDREFTESGLTVEQAEHANRVCGESDISDKKNPHFRYSC
jgi:hypothetical protein